MSQHANPLTGTPFVSKPGEIGDYLVTAQSIRTGVMQVDKTFRCPADDPARVDRMARDIVMNGLPFHDTFRIRVYRIRNGQRHIIDRWTAA